MTIDYSYPQNYQPPTPEVHQHIYPDPMRETVVHHNRYAGLTGVDFERAVRIDCLGFANQTVQSMTSGLLRTEPFSATDVIDVAEGFYNYIIKGEIPDGPIGPVPESGREP